MVGYALLGLLVSFYLVRDTQGHVRLELSEHPPEPSPLGFREVFSRTSFKDRNLLACSQAGLINNLNDGMSWGAFALFFSAFGLGVERIGILKAVYPAAWGMLQVLTGPLSDRWGRKGLIVGACGCRLRVYSSPWPPGASGGGWSVACYVARRFCV